MHLLKQSQTSEALVFRMVSSSDHVTGVTSITPTVTLSKNGGSLAAASGTVSEIGNGFYKVAGNATDSNTLGPLILRATGTGADPASMLYQIVAFDPRDTVRLGLTAMPNVASGSAGAIITSGTGTAQLSVSSGAIAALAANSVSATAIASNAITSAKIATDAIGAAQIAADAIGASELATDAVTEIVNGVWNEAQSGHTTAGTFGRYLDSQVATVATNVNTLLTRITSTLFTGITSLAEWLGLIAGKQTGNATARTEVRATGAGSGTYDETTDSQEALRDRGDAAWITATGFLDASGVRSAVGLASANLDTQLATLPTATENADELLTRDWSSVATPASRSVLNALRQLRNKWTISGTTLTVYEEDGSTTAFTATLTTAASGDIITGSGG